MNKQKFNKLNLKNKKILISGSSGFIGLNLINTLLFNFPKLKIYGIDIIKPKIYNKKGFYFIKKDLFNLDKKELPKLNFDYIIHLAGIPSPTYYKSNPLGTVFLNQDLTKILLEKSKKDKSKFIYFSSSEIYGNPDNKNIPTNETFPGYVSTVSDRSCYDESKRMGETITYIYSTLYKLDCKIIRPFNFYGEGMKKYDRRIIPQFFSQIVEKKDISVFSDGRQTRTYCHIKDAIDMIILVIFLGKSFIYNIGNDQEEISAISLARKIKKITKTNSVVKNIKYPKNYPSAEPKRRCPDISKLKKEFNFSPRIKLDEGLKMFYEFAKKNF